MGLRKNVKLFVTICAVSWKSAVCHERNKDRLDKVSRGFQIETPSLSHVPEGAWNATPFWQPKIPPSNDIRSAGILILYGSTIYSVRVNFLIVSIQIESHRSRRFSQPFEIFHYDRINGGFPSSPTPSSSFLFFRKHFNISHARCSRVRYQSIHESQIINIS